MHAALVSRCLLLMPGLFHYLHTHVQVESEFESLCNKYLKDTYHTCAGGE